MPTTLETGSLTVPDRQSIANPFKDYFASIGSNLAIVIPVANTSIDEYMCNPLSNSFSLFPVNPSEIVDEINSLNPSKSVGPFSIPTKLSKTIKILLSGPLPYLFNCSLLQVLYRIN